MLVAFVDESYPDQKNKYCVSAVVVDMVGLFDLAAGFRAVMNYAHSAFEIDPGTELHGHEIMQQRNGWKPIAGKHRAALSIYNKSLAALVASGAKVFLQGMDVERQKARYTTLHDPHEVVLRHVLERVNDYAVAKQLDVLVIADQEPGQAQHAAMMELFSHTGTPGYRSSTLPRIIQPVRFDDSHFHAGLQAADLAAYLYNRKQCDGDSHARAIKARKDLYRTMQPAIQHERFWMP